MRNTPSGPCADSPGLTGSGITMAMGIGMNSATLSMVDGLILRHFTKPVVTLRAKRGLHWAHEHRVSPPCDPVIYRGKYRISGPKRRATRGRDRRANLETVGFRARKTPK